MKQLALMIILLSLMLGAGAQERKKALPAEVEKVEGVPVFIFSLPDSKYEEVGKAFKAGHIIKVAVNENVTVREKAVQLVQKALGRKDKDKIPAFDAIIMDLYKEKAYAIKFVNKDNPLKAHVKNYEGVPVYFFSKPVGDYEVVTSLDADYSVRAARNLLLDKIESMIDRTLDKEKEGKISHFDAVIISPDDLSETLIRFK